MSIGTAGTLYVVATPIGNLQDLSPRAAQVLSSVALILAEDTRITRRLLQHIGATTPMRACHEHNERDLAAQCLARLLDGADIALVSDAGTPLISDPGFHLVGAAHEAGIKVEPVPGPSAVTAILAAAGFSAQQFVFLGYLSARQAARMREIQTFSAESRTVVLLEAPHRISACLRDLHQVLGGRRRVCVGRELTKRYETIKLASLEEMVEWYANNPGKQRGEFVVAVQGSENAPQSTEATEVLTVLLEYLTPAQAAAATARITGRRKNPIYKLALRLASKLADNEA